jgi:hypothetical protein
VSDEPSGAKAAPAPTEQPNRPDLALAHKAKEIATERGVSYIAGIELAMFEDPGLAERFRRYMKGRHRQPDPTTDGA